MIQLFKKQLLNSPFEFLLVVIVIVCVIFYLQFHWNRRRMYKLATKLKGPFAWPLIGSAFQFLGSTKQILESFDKIFTKYPGLSRIWVGPFLIYTIQTPEHIEIILKHPNSLNKSFCFKTVEPLFGQGLFTAPANIWKKHRKLIAPTFNNKLLDQFVQVFYEQSLNLCQKLEVVKNDYNFDFSYYVNDCLLNVICECVMGVKIENEYERKNYIESYERFMKLTILKACNIFYYSDFIFNLSSMGKEYNKLLKQLKNFSQKIITIKTMEFNKNLTNNIKSKLELGFLDHLIFLSQVENKLTIQEIEDEVNTFLAAGSETTSGSLNYLFCLLGMYPDIQEKVYNEIMEVVGPFEPIQAFHLQKLQYTERVIKESLRIFPVAAFTLRDINEEIHINNEITLAKNSTAFLGIINLHRNPEYFPDPLIFNPDRFLPEAVPKIHPYSFLTFLGGNRNCIGINFAMKAMKTITAALIRRYYFETAYKRVEDICLEPNLLIKPVDGFKIKIKLR